ncbi:MAG TPA: CocE/NonD family hydrolase [Gaiellaceae bacterium]|nr:CocE/NonD family hydrolase [Gaiellaceae bacterium]
MAELTAGGSRDTIRAVGVRSLLVTAVAGLALAGAGSAAAAPTPQELTVTASDGTPLACGLILPDGAPPAGGWPGVILFHGLGQVHATMEAVAEQSFALDGYASLACDARGTGASGGTFGLDGPKEDQDARDLFDWFAARPDVSDTEIAAFGISLGGGAVWNAAVAGVPFKAIAPSITWTSLSTALAPQNVPKTGLLAQLAVAVPFASWDPSLTAARDALLGGSVTSDVTTIGDARSALGALATLQTPTLLLQGRQDFLFDIDQALAAYRLLPGPKHLYLGDLGHTPAANPTAEQPVYLFEVLNWFDHYLKGQESGIDKANPVDLASDPFDGTKLSYPGIPATKTATLVLPGTKKLAAAAHVSRSAALKGGPSTSFGDSTLTIRYSGAKKWTHLVATVAVAGSKVPVTLGGVRIAKSAGVATIKLLDEAVPIAAGKRIVVTLGATSGADGVYTDKAPAGASITIGAVTLKLSLLK